jgi:hypothetical protein
MTQVSTLRVFGLAAVFSVTACGGSSPPPSDATSESSSSTSPAPASTDSSSAKDDGNGASDKAAAAPADDKKSDDSSAAAAPADSSSSGMPAKQLGDTITQPTIAYMINYNESDPKDASDKICSKESHDDPRLHAKCMEKERTHFVADVLVFGKDDKGQLFTVFRRAGKTLKEVSKSRIELKDDKGNAITVNVKSDKGSRPVFMGKKEFSVTAPSDATIQLDDPKFGKLTYDARIGLVNGGGGGE